MSQRISHLSILDTEFHCAIEEQTVVGGLNALITRVDGRAWLTGVSYYESDPEDPFHYGYRLSDTWLAC